MAPTPKPAGQRRRRNAVAGIQTLPDAALEYRPCPVKDAKVEEWWEEAWVSPMRHGWKVGDGIALDRLALLWHAFLRGDGKNPIEGAILAIEDRLGLSPKARRMMGWEIERGGGDSKAAAGPQPVDDMRQRLKAVP